MFDMKKIGHRISALRRSRSMTQTELAERLGISFQAVSSWERGNAMPDIAKLPELARMFGVTVDWLIGSPDELPDTPEPVLTSAEEAPLVVEAEQPDALPQTPAPEALPAAEEPAQERKNVDFSEVQELLPFLSDDVVKEIAERALMTGGPEAVVRYAPFMDEDDIDAMTESMLSDSEKLNVLLPFVSDDKIGSLARMAYATHGVQALGIFLPFMDEEDVDAIAEQAMEDGAEIKQFLSFISEECAARMARKVVRQGGVAAVKPFAPFMDEEDLSALVREYLL